MRIPSGVTDQKIYFVAVDSTDFTTRETGLTTFTVYRSRNGGTATVMTTPTVSELDATNMPGVYSLLLDEDMTIDAGDDTQEMCFHITQASMNPVSRTIELYRPKITAGYTLGVESDGDLTKVNTLNGHTAQTGDTYALANGVTGFAAIDTAVDSILVDTGTTIPATIATAQADLDIITGATGVNLLTATQASIDAIEADTNELQTDNVPGLIATAQADLDIITGATGVNLLAATQASIDAIEADTNELQTDNVPGLIATAQADLDIITGADGVNLLTATQASIDAIEADTNELQSDDIPTTLAALNDISVADILAGVCDTGVTVAKAGEMLAALAAGIVTASSSGGVTTLTYKKRDGSTTSFTTVVTESDKTRATSGALS